MRFLQNLHAKFSPHGEPKFQRKMVCIEKTGNFVQCRYFKQINKLLRTGFFRCTTTFLKLRLILHRKYSTKFLQKDFLKVLKIDSFSSLNNL